MHSCSFQESTKVENTPVVVMRWAGRCHCVKQKVRSLMMKLVCLLTVVEVVRHECVYDKINNKTTNTFNEYL